MFGFGFSFSNMLNRNARNWLKSFVRTLPSNITFTRASSVTVPDYLGALQTLPANQVAFENLRLSYSLAEGATLGPELNPTLNFTGFTSQGPGSVVTSGSLVLTAASSGTPAYKPMGILGRVTFVTYTISSISSGNILIHSGGGGSPGTVRTTLGTYSDTLLNNGSFAGVDVTAANPTTATLTAISVKEVIPIFLTTALDGITPLVSQGALNTRIGDNGDTAGSVFSSTGIPSAAPWIYEVQFKAKLDSAQIVTPQALWGQYLDAPGNNTLRISSTGLDLTKMIGSVATHVTMPLTIAVNQEPKTLIRCNADGSFDLFSGGVKATANTTVASAIINQPNFGVLNNGQLPNATEQYYGSLVKSGLKIGTFSDSYCISATT